MAAHSDGFETKKAPPNMLKGRKGEPGGILYPSLREGRVTGRTGPGYPWMTTWPGKAQR